MEVQSSIISQNSNYNFFLPFEGPMLTPYTPGNGFVAGVWSEQPVNFGEN